MKIYVFLADGFEETEAICPWDMLIRAGADVQTVSINAGKRVTGAHGLSVEAALTASELPREPSGEICVVLPGGMPGARNLDADPVVDRYVRYAAAHGHIGAICAAPLIPGRRGLLCGHAAVCFPSFEHELAGAAISDKKVITDGNITTARGMGVAFDFGAELIRVLCGAQAAAEVVSATQA